MLTNKEAKTRETTSGKASLEEGREEEEGKKEIKRERY